MFRASLFLDGTRSNPKHGRFVMLQDEIRFRHDFTLNKTNLVLTYIEARLADQLREVDDAMAGYRDVADAVIETDSRLLGKWSLDAKASEVLIRKILEEVNATAADAFGDADFPPLFESFDPWGWRVAFDVSVFENQPGKSP